MSYLLITGGAQRIGKEIATLFYQNGYDLILHYNNSSEAAKSLAEELQKIRPGKVILIQQDLMEEGAAAKIFAQLHQQEITPKILINNASIYRRSPLIELSKEQIDEDFRINFYAPLELMQEMAKQKETGVIINMLDQRVAITEANSGTYGLAKKSLKESTKLAAIEWAPKLRVNAIAPGLVLPPPGAAPEKIQELLVNVPMQKLVNPSEIAKTALFLAESSSITGEIIYVDGGQHLAPIIKAEVANATYKG